MGTTSPGRVRWYLLAGGFAASALALLAFARPSRFDRAAVGAAAAMLVLGAAAALGGALLRRTWFRLIVGIELAILLFFVLWGVWFLLPMAVLHIGALFTGQPERDRRSAIVVASGAGLAALSLAAAALVVPTPRPPLWACYTSANPSGAETNAMFDVLSRPTGKGSDLLPGVQAVGVWVTGMRVDIETYATDDELATIRGLMAGAPGVSAVRSGDPCAS